MSKVVTMLLPLSGNGTITLADSTPGMARTRGRNCSKNAMMFSFFGYADLRQPHAGGQQALARTPG